MREELLRTPVRFDRNELAGAFGDIGTDLPLIVGMILAVGLDAASVFIVFGLLQVLSGLWYRLPMPVQPLKAMAVLVITEKIGGDVLRGAGLAIGAAMLALTLTGGLTALVRLIPLAAVRGIQFGLGLSLASLALRDYVRADGAAGYVLAAAGFVLMLALLGNRRVPGGLIVILIGVAFAAAFRVDFAALAEGVGPALPQLPLSLSNSVVATRQTVADLFPGRGITVKKIGLTYSLMNLAAPWLGGIPVCHGCGGLAGHYAFGGRTGGSVIIYGSLYLAIGLLLSGALEELLLVFPRPILGVVLLFEALTLLLFIRDQAGDRRALMVALLSALLAFTLPQGYVIALVVGTATWYLSRRNLLLRHEGDAGGWGRP
jgi:hypothetical protein